MMTAARPGPRHSRIPAEAVTDRRLRGCARDVLMALGVHTDRNGWCVRSLSRIAAELGYDVRSVRRAVRQLEDIGYVEVSGRRGASGVVLASGYRLLAPQPAAAGGTRAPESGSPGHQSPGEADSQESGGLGLSGVRPIALTASSNEAAAGAVAPARESAAQAAAAAAEADSGGEGGWQAGQAAGHDARQRRMAGAVALHRRVCERLGTPAGYRDELGEVVAWLEAGYRPDEVMAAVERAARRKAFQAPLMLRYFREIIAETSRARPAMPPRDHGVRMLPPPGGATAPEPAGPPEWLALRAHLRHAVGEDLYASWFARLDWGGVSEGTLMLAAPSRFVANWIRRHHGQRLDVLAAAAVPGVNAVEVVVELAVERRRAKGAAR